MSTVTTATAPPAEPTAHRRPRPVLHPFLFTIFPIVFLVAQNPTDDIRLADVLWVLAIALAGTAVVLGIARLVLRDVHAAGFVTSGFVLLFFSFGRVDLAVDPNQLARHRHALFLVYALIGLIILLIGVRFRGRFGRITPGLNLIAAVLVLLNLVPIVTAGPRSGTGVVGEDVALTAPAHPRDVYYIIFDRYADEITLHDRFHYDNTPFLTALGDRGFDVVTDAVANYPKTAHSLASSLNMSFLDGLVQEQGADSDDWGPIYSSLQDFRVARALTSIGYTYDHIGSWWSPTYDDPSADTNFIYGRGEFEQTLLDTTIWPTMAGALDLSDEVDPQLTQYRRVLFQFDTVDRISRDPAPTFTFAHFTLPHPPYVFDEDGNYVVPEQWNGGADGAYLAQLKYTNGRILEMVDQLLAGPDDTDPIVVIQSDEGPHPDRLEADEDSFEWPDATDTELGEKFRILDALYLPGEGTDAELGSFTPVNSFRIIFDRYFDADLPLLPDRTWVFQDSTHPYRMTEITDRLATLQT